MRVMRGRWSLVLRFRIPSVITYGLLSSWIVAVCSGLIIWQAPKAIAGPAATDQDYQPSSDRPTSGTSLSYKIAQNFQSRRKLRSYNNPRKSYREQLEQLFSEDQWDTDRSPWVFHSGRYRTMCVRLCDGYYFPVSFSVRPGQFHNDEQICRSRCAAPVELFVYRNPGSSIDHMRSLTGQKYRHLANAYLYRKKFVASCRCNPEPWTVAERSRHHFYATGKPLPELSQVNIARNESDDPGQRLLDGDPRRPGDMIDEHRPVRTVRSNYLIIRFEGGREVSSGAQPLSEQIVRSKYYRGPARATALTSEPAAIEPFDRDPDIRIEIPSSSGGH